MPRQATSGAKGVYIEFDGRLLDEMRRLAEKLGHSFKEEVQHACRRHLDVPPTLAAVPLPAAEAAPAKSRRGRPPKKKQGGAP
jgi:hypothetical protein